MAAVLDRLPPALRQTALYAFTVVLGRAVAFVMFPVTTAFLAPADYGALEMLTAIADGGTVLVGFGLVNAMYRFAGPGHERVAGRVLGLALVFGLIAMFAGQVLVSMVAHALPADLPVLAVRLIVAALAMSAAVEVGLCRLRMTERALFFTVASTVRTIGQAILVLVGLLAGWGVVAVAAAAAVANSLLAIVLIVRLWPDCGLALRFDRRLLAYAVPMVVSALALFAMGSLDRWLLVGWISMEEIGLYGVAARIALIVSLLLQPFDLWWYPRRLNVLQGEDGVRLSARTVDLGLLLVGLAVLSVGLFGPFLLTAMTPAAYHNATQYLPWLAMLAGLHAACNLINVGSYARADGWQPAIVNGAAAAVTFVGFLALIPFFGLAGAIAAKFAGMLFRLVVFFHLSQREVRLPLVALRPLPLTAALALCVWIGVHA